MKNITENMKEYLNDAGELPFYAWPGGYPMFYIDNGGNVLCPSCANNNDEFTEPISNSDINYENDFLYCDHCSNRIESAYGENEEI